MMVSGFSQLFVGKLVSNGKPQPLERGSKKLHWPGRPSLWCLLVWLPDVWCTLAARTKKKTPQQTPKPKELHLAKGWCFQNDCVYFSPPWGDDPIWLIFFQRGWLKPPTRKPRTVSEKNCLNGWITALVFGCKCFNLALMMWKCLSLAEWQSCTRDILGKESLSRFPVSIYMMYSTKNILTYWYAALSCDYCVYWKKLSNDFRGHCEETEQWKWSGKKHVPTVRTLDRRSVNTTDNVWWRYTCWYISWHMILWYYTIL